MDKKELLQKYYDLACHNLLCYSKNWAMTEPKEGYEVEWKQAKEECALLEEMIKEATPEERAAELEKKVAELEKAVQPKEMAQKVAQELAEGIESAFQFNNVMDKQPTVEELTPKDLECIARYIQAYARIVFHEEENVPLPCEKCPHATENNCQVWTVFRRLGKVTGIKLSPLKGSMSSE